MKLVDFEIMFNHVRQSVARQDGTMQGHDAPINITVVDQNDDDLDLVDILEGPPWSCGCPSSIELRVHRDPDLQVEPDVGHLTHQITCIGLLLNRLGVPKEIESKTLSIIERVEWLAHNPQETDCSLCDNGYGDTEWETEEGENYA